jgi:hypothetical protein
MTASASLTRRKGPTLATLRAIEKVLRLAAVPMTRYKIRQALRNSVGQPPLDEALAYMAEHEMVYDEGPGGSVLWIQTSATTRARLHQS